MTKSLILLTNFFKIVSLFACFVDFYVLPYMYKQTNLYPNNDKLLYFPPIANDAYSSWALIADKSVNMFVLYRETTISKSFDVGMENVRERVHKSIVATILI